MGDFKSGTPVGSVDTASSSDYRIGMTGAQLNALGIARIKIETASGYSVVIEGPFNGNGFDNACSSSNCNGNSLGANSLGVTYYWHGGNNGGTKPYGSGHFGMSRKASHHPICDDGDPNDDHWGHFHRSGVNSGVYVFGDSCINENEWQERFFFYAEFESR